MRAGDRATSYCQGRRALRLIANHCAVVEIVAFGRFLLDSRLQWVRESRVLLVMNTNMLKHFVSRCTYLPTHMHPRTSSGTRWFHRVTQSVLHSLVLLPVLRY